MFQPAHRHALLTNLAWRLAEVMCMGLLVAASGLGLLVARQGAHNLTWGDLTLVRADTLSVAMLALLGFVAWVIVRYAGVYLTGEARRMRYLGSLLATVAAIAVLALTDNLLVLALAWVTTDLTLHPLLTFFRERRPAMLAAHKKLLLSGVANVAMLGATTLIWQTLGTVQISVLSQTLAHSATLSPTLEGAAALIGLAVILKCAQLPFHGWLIQVMEAPTPVSALLHAGIVNIGGFVLIRLSALMTQAPEVQTALAWVGGVTALLAALVAMTRISIKVQLAWSTCAQMGFMMLECALGAYEVALLHLLAHSLYKAHAFLSSGQAVDASRIRQMAPQDAPRPAWAWGARMVVGSGLALGLHAALPPWLAPNGWSDPAHALLYTTVALALGYKLAMAPSGPGLQAGLLQGILPALTSGARVLLIAGGYLLLHKAFATMLALPHWPSQPGALVAAALCIGLLLAAQGAICLSPNGRFSRWLYPQAFAGFHLDEGFTRLTQWLWPARLPAGQQRSRPVMWSSAEQAS